MTCLLPACPTPAACAHAGLCIGAHGGDRPRIGCGGQDVDMPLDLTPFEENPDVND